MDRQRQIVQEVNLKWPSLMGDKAFSPQQAFAQKLRDSVDTIMDSYMGLMDAAKVRRCLLARSRMSSFDFISTSPAHLIHRLEPGTHS